MKRKVGLLALTMATFGLGYGLAALQYERTSSDSHPQDVEALLVAHISAIATVEAALRAADRPPTQRSVLEGGLEHFARMGGTVIAQAPDLPLDYIPNLRDGIERALEYAVAHKLDPAAVSSLHDLTVALRPRPVSQ